jgi:hypothetical protein
MHVPQVLYRNLLQGHGRKENGMVSALILLRQVISTRASGFMIVFKAMALCTTTTAMYMRAIGVLSAGTDEGC